MKRGLKFLATVALIGFVCTVSADNSTGKLLTGRAAMNDWTQDAPGVRHKITTADLPAPNESQSASNGPNVVKQPDGTQLHVPAGFKIEQIASGLRDPRFLLTAPNGDLFVTESRANQIKVLRDTSGDAKPEMTEIFAESGSTIPSASPFIRPVPTRNFSTSQTPPASFVSRIATAT